MASGDFLYPTPLYSVLDIPWDYPYTANAQIGYENYYDDGQGGCYCGPNTYYLSGAVIVNQFNIGYGIFSDSTGQFNCIAYSDGTGSYYWRTVYNYGVILECSEILLNINTQLFNNGTQCLLSDGTGSSFYVYSYCPLGFSFFNSDSVNYTSDGTGSYCLSDLFFRNNLDLCINWDFSKSTKSKYNFCTMDACGENILLCLNNLSSCFYEINSICQTLICLFEADQNQSLFIEDSCSAFIYIRNLGPNDINLILSNQSGYYSFKECQIFNKINFSGQNLTLREKESLIFSLQVSQDGTSYYSNVFYPFGFFYKFNDVEIINQLGVYPVCCVFDSVNNKYFPSYLYADVCNLPIESGCIVETGYGFNYRKQLSFGEKLKVDCFSSLEISFQKQTGTGVSDIFYINTGFNINSYYGLNSFESSIRTNSIQITDENGACLITCENLNYSKIIETNSCISIIYDIDVNSNKIYNLIYLDCSSGLADYDLNIKKINNLNECTVFTKTDLINSGNVLKLKNNETAYVEINLGECSSIKDLSNKSINRNNLYLPVLQNFDYNYCFELNKSNYIFNKIATGFWVLDNIEATDSGFCNYSTIIDFSNSNYLLYKSNIYSIKLCNYENRVATSSIQDKSLFQTSDDFFIPRSNVECCFYFCDLEFRYNPVECILYRNNYYSVPSDTILIDFCLSGNCETISFPKNAINYEKLKINTNYEIFETIECSKIDINYSDFSFIKNYSDSNYICYTIPIVQLPNLSGYEYPQVLIENNIKQKKQTNIQFDINPLNGISKDASYGLNNFLYFLISKLNSGLALDFLNCGTKMMCDYCYGSIEYNFLMMDLKCEYDSNLSTLPSGCWYNILQLISLEDGYGLISYKNITGNGYNYIAPLITEINYSDQFSGDSSLICSEIIQTGLLNYISTGFNYDGSSRSINYLFNESGNLTGCYISIDSGSYLSIINNSYFINLQSSDLTGALLCRDINILKNYSFTGIQPFFINSNYVMLDIREPMLCNNLQNYSSSVNEEQTSGIFYYTYDITNPQNIPLKLISPEFTYISDVSWGDNVITPFSNSSMTGLIQNNSAKINLNICNLIYENPYILNCECIQSICINMIGGL